MSISLKDPSTILAIALLIAMALGPWILHEKTLARVEFKLDSLEYKVSGLERANTENKTILDERKKAFEDIMADLKSEFRREKWEGKQP